MFKTLFKEASKTFSSKTKLVLLKEIEKTTADLFTKHESFAEDLLILGSEKKDIVLHSVLTQNFKGITEFSDEFYKILKVASKRQELTRQFIIEALQELNHGFDEFDSKLIHHACLISSFYDKFYESWIKAVQGNKVSEKLNQFISEKKEISKELLNPYTIIQLNEKNEFHHIAYSIYFKNELTPIVKQLELMLKDLEELKKTTEHEAYIKFLQQQKTCFEETDISKLDAQWEKLDDLWMDVKSPIQIVHDIETGYGDPTRCKCIPDFSLRFMDETFLEQNKTIDEIKHIMVEYFKKRDSKFAKNGIHALLNSHAAIYYIPFCSGMSFHFRFTGQSIPNRDSVKNAKGVKIYFDPISSQSRKEETTRLTNMVFSKPDQLVSQLSEIDTIVYLVAAHEFGHAIYNLECVSEYLRPESSSLLEEPRAELTSLTTLKLMYDAKFINEESMKKNLLNFCLDDLRRYAKYDSSATRPYTISSLNCYKIYEKTGYLTLKNDKIEINQDKSVEVLSIKSDEFSAFLDAIDELNGEKIEKIGDKMQKECELTKFLISKLFEK
eukprot:gene4488-7869_t